MTPHKWIVIFTAGLSASFTTGCLHSLCWGDSAKNKGELTKPVTSDKDEKPAEQEAGSSYHPTLSQEAMGPPRPTDEETRAAQYQEETAAVKKSVAAEEKTETAENKEQALQTTENSGVKISVEPAPPVEEPLVTAIRCLLEKHTVEAREQLRNYDKSNQDLLVHLLALAVRLTEGNLDNINPTDLSLILDQLRALEQPLASKAALKINKLCLVRRQVENFGIYEKLPDDYVYAAGSGDQPGERVLVYAELRNFLSLPSGNQCETHLMTSVEIKDYQGNVLKRLPCPTPPDRSQTPRQDYFTNCKFWVPPGLPPGSYTLWVIVKDVTGLAGKEPPAHRIAQRSLDFRVTSHGTTHGSRGGPGVVLQSGEGENDRRNQQARARKPSEP